MFGCVVNSRMFCRDYFVNGCVFSLRKIRKERPSVTSAAVISEVWKMASQIRNDGFLDRRTIPIHHGAIRTSERQNFGHLTGT